MRGCADGPIIDRKVKRKKESVGSTRQSKAETKAVNRPRYSSERELIRAKEALERKTAELALSLSMMQATLDSTTDAIVVTDMNGHVRDFNEKYAQIMGVT